MTRLMKSFSSGDVRQDAGDTNTTTSPRCGSRKSYTIRLTSTRSFTFRVCSMDPDGIQKICTTKARTRTATQTETRTRIGHSSHGRNEPRREAGGASVCASITHADYGLHGE